MFPRRIDINARKLSTARSKLWSARLVMLRVLAPNLLLSASGRESDGREAQAPDRLDGFLLNEI
jgi:hypothetical protein